MNFCSECGHTVRFAIPDGDNRPRFLCDSCGTIHYQNPRIIAGTLPYLDNKVLLCKRAIEPRYGYWTLPAGFMENKESLDQAALRETFEEATASINQPELYTVISLPHVDQVFMIFRGELAADFAPGVESLEVAMFSEEEVPWDQLAFPTIERSLRHFFADQKQGRFDVHVSEVTREDRQRFFKVN